MRRYLRVATIFLLIFTGSSAWGAGITVGVSTGYPPYYYEKDGELVGICIELVNIVARELSLEVTYKVFPWKRLLFSARHGQVDAIMPLFRTKEREQFLYFDGLGIAYETNHFFTSKDLPVRYGGSFEDLKVYRIGVVSDYSYGEKFDRFEHFNKIVTLSDKHLVDMFKQKRFDIGVGNKYVTLFYAGQEGVAEQIKFLNPPIAKELLYIGFTKERKNSELAKQFAEKLGRFKNTDQYRLLMDRYGMSP